MLLTTFNKHKQHFNIYSLFIYNKFLCTIYSFFFLKEQNQRGRFDCKQCLIPRKEGKETKWKSALKCSFLGVHFLLIVVI